LRGVDANGHAIPITKPELIPPGLELNPAREMAAIRRNGVDPDWTIEGRLATCAVTRRRFPVGASPTRGATVLSDAPSFDTKWLCDLYRATGAEPPFVLRDFHQIAWHEAALRGRRPDIAIVKAEAEAYILFPKQHRAGPDAWRNAEMLRQIQGLLPI
jgi:hypothetical protein